MRKIACITGSSGQDGSYLAELLLNKNYIVVAADRRSARNDNWRHKYLNLEKKKKFKENEQLGGNDVYSGSKAASEIIIQSYKKSFFKNQNCQISTVRSGNCIGGGDWTKDRIMKDCAEKLISNTKLTIRSPKASRPGNTLWNLWLDI